MRVRAFARPAFFNARTNEGEGCAILCGQLLKNAQKRNLKAVHAKLRQELSSNDEDFFFLLSFHVHHFPVVCDVVAALPNASCPISPILLGGHTLVPFGSFRRRVTTAYAPHKMNV
jgi:hypothetical protein